MEIKQIDIDAAEIFEIYKTKGAKEAAERFADIVDQKKLVLWVTLALRSKVSDLIVAHKKEQGEIK